MSRIQFSQKGNMNRIRFSDEWKEKVNKWAEDNAAMIDRYEALQNYRELQVLANEITGDEMHQFFYGGDFCNFPDGEEKIDSEGGPEDDMLADDWPQAF